MKKSLEKLVDSLIEDLDSEAREAESRAQTQQRSKESEEQRAKKTRAAAWVIVGHLKSIVSELYGKFLNAGKSSSPYILSESDAQNGPDIGRLKKGELVTLASFAFYRPNTDRRSIIRFVVEHGTGFAPEIVVAAYGGPEESGNQKRYKDFPVSSTVATKEWLEDLVEQIVADIRKSA